MDLIKQYMDSADSDSEHTHSDSESFHDYYKESEIFESEEYKPPSEEVNLKYCSTDPLGKKNFPP